MPVMNELDCDCIHLFFQKALFTSSIPKQGIPEDSLLTKKLSLV